VGESWGTEAPLAALLARRSVRQYLADAPPDGTLERLIAAAQSASSSSNLHTWSVVAVTESASCLCADQGMNTPGAWSRHSAQRIATVKALRGRHTLGESLRGKRFGLK